MKGTNRPQMSNRGPRIMLLSTAMAGVALILITLIMRSYRSDENLPATNPTGGNPSLRATPKGVSSPDETINSPQEPEETVLQMLPKKHAAENPEGTLDHWVDRLRRIKRDPPNSDSAEQAASLLVTELVTWIGVDEVRFREVSSLVAKEDEVAIWAPALLALAQCKVPERRDYFIRLIQFSQDPEKCEMAGLMAFRENADKGSAIYFTGIIQFGIPKKPDSEIVRTLADRLTAQGTNDTLRLALMGALWSIRASDDPAVRDVLLAVLENPNEGQLLRQHAAFALARTTSVGPAVERTAIELLNDHTLPEHLLKNVSRIVGKAESEEGKVCLVGVVSNTAYPERVREGAAHMLQFAMGDQNVVYALLQSYSVQPFSVRMAILHSLSKSSIQGVAELIRALPAESLEELNEFREHVISELRGTEKSGGC